LQPYISIIGIKNELQPDGRDVGHSVGQKWNAYTNFDGARENIKNVEDPVLNRRIIL